MRLSYSSNSLFYSSLLYLELYFFLPVCFALLFVLTIACLGNKLICLEAVFFFFFFFLVFFFPINIRFFRGPGRL